MKAARDRAWVTMLVPVAEALALIEKGGCWVAGDHGLQGESAVSKFSQAVGRHRRQVGEIGGGNLTRLKDYTACWPTIFGSGSRRVWHR